MAAYTVNRAKSAALTAATVDTVTFPAFGVFAYLAVAVTNRDTTNPIFFTIDGSTPTVGGDDCFCANVGQTVSLPFNGGAVKLISTGTSAYTVQGASNTEA